MRYRVKRFPHPKLEKIVTGCTIATASTHLDALPNTSRPCNCAVIYPVPQQPTMLPSPTHISPSTTPQLIFFSLLFSIPCFSIYCLFVTKNLMIYGLCGVGGDSENERDLLGLSFFYQFMHHVRVNRVTPGDIKVYVGGGMNITSLVIKYQVILCK